MKKLLLFTLCFAVSLAYAQVNVQFFENFDSFNDGDLIAASSADWDTWSSAPGGAEDAPVTTEQAFSGMNSLKLQSLVTSGGPTDVVLPFQGIHSSGNFTLEMMMYVASGNAAYFNIQGGSGWGDVFTFEFYWNEDGTYRIGNLATGFYEHDTWFKISFDCNMNQEVWTFLMNDVPLASFDATGFAASGIDLYPYNPMGTSLYYIDDVRFIQQDVPDGVYDVAITNLSVGGLANQTSTITGTVKNIGTDTVTSFNVTVVDDSGSNTATYDGFSLVNGESYTINWSPDLQIVPGINQVKMSVNEPNGQLDEYPVNNEYDGTFNALTPAPGKRVLVEEATGTWCSWCPRGAVFMDLMAEIYPEYFIGVAVHNADPMVVDEYDAGLRGLVGFTGFPSLVIDRSTFLDPSGVEGPFLTRLTEAPPAMLEVGAEYDDLTRELTISVKADMITTMTGLNRLNVAIVEDSVRGSGPGWDQANSYAGGGNGVMGGYELLPHPVPASQMVYNHVGRAVLGGFQGPLGSLPTHAPAGSTHIYQYSYTLPDDYKYENIHIVGMLVGSNGRIENASSETIDGALSNGLSVGLEDVVINKEVNALPNPAHSNTNITFSLTESTNVQAEVYNYSGKLIAKKDYGKLSGDISLPFELSSLDRGIYMVKLYLGNELLTKRILLQ